MRLKTDLKHQLNNHYCIGQTRQLSLKFKVDKFHIALCAILT